MRGVFADVWIIFPTTIALSAGGFADQDATIQQRGIVSGDRIRRDFNRFLRQACLGNDQQILQPRAVLLDQLSQKRALITVTWLETNVGVERMADDSRGSRLFQRLQHLAPLAKDPVPFFGELRIVQSSCQDRESAKGKRS